MRGDLTRELTGRGRRTRAAGVIGAAAALLLSACTGQDPEPQPTAEGTTTAPAPEQSASAERPASPDQSPTESSEVTVSAPPTDEPTEGGGRSDEGSDAGVLPDGSLLDVLLPAEEVPGDLMSDRAETEVGRTPFTMSMNLTGFEPEGQCAQALEEINTFEAQSRYAAQVEYEVDPAQAEQMPVEPSVAGIVAVTEDPVDAMGVYSRLESACGTVTSTVDPSATATFTQIGDLDAVHIELDAGPMNRHLAFGGDSEGVHHVYLAAQDVPEEDLQPLFEAQVDRFQDAVAQAAG